MDTQQSSSIKMPEFEEVMKSTSDPVISATEEQIRLLSNELFHLREEENHLKAEKENLQIQVDELKKLLAATTASVQSLWEKVDQGSRDDSNNYDKQDLLQSPPNVFNLHASSPASTSYKESLALAGEDNVRRQVELLTDSQSNLATVRNKLIDLRKTIDDKIALEQVLITLLEDRRTLNSAKDVKERASKQRKWAVALTALFRDLGNTSLKYLASQKDIITLLKSKKNGREPGLDDFLLLSNQQIEELHKRMGQVINNDEGVVDPLLKQTVMEAFIENANLRLESNQIAGFRLEKLDAT